uniref:Uncharacterized protein n=1 Tax=Lotharella oceanica TaxID=641309 RepID=A0A7S2U2X2_9EUKA|mmetsp:Transcript_5751/g.11392  ORF Transcript_5751/g.11392 Transcript_5751/m.11392 type:complete len:103 (+) Transcript_5751:83-391(+)
MNPHKETTTTNQQKQTTTCDRSIRRYVEETDTLEFGTGAAFTLCLVVCVFEMFAATLMHVMRFQALVTRLDKSSRGSKKISTYGSIEIVLEPTLYQKPTWGC